MDTVSDRRVAGGLTFRHRRPAVLLGQPPAGGGAGRASCTAGAQQRGAAAVLFMALPAGCDSCEGVDVKYLVELPVEGEAGPGQLVRVEVEPAGEGLIQVSRPGQVAARAARSLGEMLAGIRPVAESFVEGLGGMAQAPEEISLEFGLSMSAEADLVISTTTAQANFKVSLTWRPPSAEAGQTP
ncbi:CU044_2847 family protein [Kitasatospora aureofaciens]|uniref:CU044_2847 family protein n=1 Tax=Kitasatospora aureofaciens TaxID=1894 RepID=UPI001F2F4A8D|nr:CU044_2847 family protein [Kitasatospora aureofaciens]